MGDTHDMAVFIAGTRDIPSEALGRAEGALVDFLGCASAGVAQPTGARILAYAEEMLGRGGCSVVGSTINLVPGDAALVNGTLGHALDYDDITFRMLGHPGVAIFPALLALGELRGSGTRSLLSAYCVGYEVATKVGSLVHLNHHQAGWHPTATLGTLGAVAATANLLELDVPEVERALGIAVSLAGGVKQNFGTDTKPFHAGRAASNGVTAALLGSRGFTADESIMEAQWGFYRVFVGKEWTPRFRIGDVLGNGWDIIDPGFTTKMYPACISTHTAIPAALELADEFAIEPRDVQRVEARVVHVSPEILIHHRPVTGLQGKFSLEYCVARALVSHSVRLEHFTTEAVQDPIVRGVMERVDMVVDAELDREWVKDQPRPTILRVTMKNGESVERRVDFPPGSPQRPSTDVELRRKYTDCVGLSFSEDQVAASLDVIRRMGSDDVPIGEVMRAFRGVAGNAIRR